MPGGMQQRDLISSVFLVMLCRTPSQGKTLEILLTTLLAQAWFRSKYFCTLLCETLEDVGSSVDARTKGFAPSARLVLLTHNGTVP